MPTVKVWDILVRVLHWSLVVSFAVAWVTHEDASSLHYNAGYIVLAIVAVRFLWGFVGSRYARFHQFITSPGATVSYALAVARNAAPRYLGHNPLGGWMIITLLGLAFVTSGTGWLLTTDSYHEVEWMEELHETGSNLMLLCILLHVLGVIFTSWHQGENLVAAMFTGKKRAHEDADAAPGK